MTRFIDKQRSARGVEPICDVIEIAPATYYEQVRRPRNPETAPPRVKQDKVLMLEIRRVWTENFQVYGIRKG